MRYGENSHGHEKEFDDDEVEDSTDAGRVTMTERTIPHFPRRKANNSNIQGVGFAIRVPNSMQNISMSTSPSITYNPVPVSRLHDSTPSKVSIPSTKFRVNNDFPKIGGSMFEQKKKKV